MKQWSVDLKKKKDKNETQSRAGRLRWGCLKQEAGGSIVATTTAASKSQIITATSFSAVLKKKNVYKEIKDGSFGHQSVKNPCVAES